MATLIKVNGSEQTLPNADLETLQQAVGGYIEVIHLPNGKALVVDEEGHLKKKPLNFKATRMMPMDLRGIVVGDVVLTEKGELK